MLGRMQSNTPPLQELASLCQSLDSVINHETFHSLLPWKTGFPGVMETCPVKIGYELRHRASKYKSSQFDYCEENVLFMVHSAVVAIFINPGQ